MGCRQRNVQLGRPVACLSIDDSNYPYEPSPRFMEHMELVKELFHKHQAQRELERLEYLKTAV